MSAEFGRSIPKISQLEEELSREKYRQRYRKVLWNTVFMLITVSAVAVLIATLWLPIYRIYGTSMAPTLADGNIVACVKGSEFKKGDICAFYLNNKVLIKRIIAMSGDTVNISEDGTVFVNDIAISEPYIEEKSFGDTDLEFPYKVPDGRYFVLGDSRSVSSDSRNSNIGCIAQEEIVGKIVFRVWPLSDFGTVE